MIAAMVILWSIRLGTHLLIRIARKHPEEDGRYRQLRKDWGDRFRPKMAGFFQLQALSVVLLGIPFLAACANAGRGDRALEWCGRGPLARRHQRRGAGRRPAFARSRGRRNAGMVCDVGPLALQQAPQLFLRVADLGLPTSSSPAPRPGGGLGIISPACILYLLLRVTGIPATEEQSVRSKGDAYRRYQERTSAFVPLPQAHASNMIDALLEKDLLPDWLVRIGIRRLLAQRIRDESAAGDPGRASTPMSTT